MSFSSVSQLSNKTQQVRVSLRRCGSNSPVPSRTQALATSKSAFAKGSISLHCSVQKRAVSGCERRGGMQVSVTMNRSLKDVSEKSARVNEELLRYFYKQDLETRVQRAMNLEMYDEVRATTRKIAEVEEIINERLQQKGGKAPSDEMTDATVTGLQLRSELQAAIEEERYEDAAKLRDRLAVVEEEVKTQQEAAEAEASKRFAFALGQRVVHAGEGWRGVVCGFEHQCLESEDWKASTQVAELQHGMRQPWYQVLVDFRDSGEYCVALVPEERLQLLDSKTVPKDVNGRREELQHPYTNLLFFGMDPQGNYIPTRHLRERYNVERKDSEEDDDEEVEEDPQLLQ